MFKTFNFINFITFSDNRNLTEFQRNYANVVNQLKIMIEKLYTSYMVYEHKDIHQVRLYYYPFFHWLAENHENSHH